jgi:hypothetical protein
MKVSITCEENYDYLTFGYFGIEAAILIVSKVGAKKLDF